MMHDPASHDVTRLLGHLGGGDPGVAEQLLPLVYDELHAVAERLFVRQPSGHTLQPTALVHEAWLKLAGSNQDWETRGHFFSVAARAMRQVLTDSARRRRSDRRGGGVHRVTFDDQVVGERDGYELLDIDEALQHLAEANERHARVAELRLFTGMALDEIAKLLGVTLRTVQMDWRAASAYLRHVLEAS